MALAGLRLPSSFVFVSLAGRFRTRCQHSPAKCGCFDPGQTNPQAQWPDGNQVSIEAEVKKEKEEKKGGKVVHTERYYGKESRSFVLGSDIDSAKAEAKYQNGVLELTLPKKANGSSKELKVQ